MTEHAPASAFAGRSAPSPYPVDPKVHVTDKSLTPEIPGSVRAAIANDVAYARYALETLTKSDVSSPSRNAPSVEALGRDAIAIALGAIGAQSGIHSQVVWRQYQLSATQAERDAFRKHIFTGALGSDPKNPGPMSASSSRAVDLTAQMRQCTGEGYSEAQCCTALATPWLLLDDAKKLAADSAAWNATDQEARDGVLYSALPQRRIAESRASLAGLSTPLFELQNTKAWLAVCAPILQNAPKSLTEFKARFGDYTAGSGWDSELHPVSMAKLAPRRIYRNQAKHISVAESISEACTVRETEVVIERPDGIVDFWSYGPDGKQENHGFFPAKLGVDAVKPTPDSCMGCHYKFDSRRFDIRIPSYKALGLTLRSSRGVPQWVDGSKCAKPGEAIVWHDRPSTP